MESPALAAFRRHTWGLTSGSAELVFPAIPSLAAPFTEELLLTFARMQRPYNDAQSEELREAMHRHFRRAFRASPRAQVKVQYDTDGPEAVAWRVTDMVRDEADDYRAYGSRAELPLFPAGSDPDPFRELLATLGPAPGVRCLDVGAGHGTATLALARLGHPVDAVEPVAFLASSLEQALARAKVKGMVVRGEFADGVKLPQPRYRFAVFSGMGSRFRGVSPMRRLLDRLGGVLEPKGLALVDVLLADEDVYPEPLHRELAEAAFCPLLTREQVAMAVYSTPFELVLDLHDYDHLTSEPGRGAWAAALFGAGTVPMRMHRLVYRRT
jgi:SAM-dependent methyltransferase